MVNHFWLALRPLFPTSKVAAFRGNHLNHPEDHSLSKVLSPQEGVYGSRGQVNTNSRIFQTHFLQGLERTPKGLSKEVIKLVLPHQP